MGKKNRKKNKVSPNGKPFVSVCTPTYNRKKFIPYLIVILIIVKVPYLNFIQPLKYGTIRTV